MDRKLLPLQSSGLEVKVNGNDPVRITGYASVFGGIDSYGDRIAEGAYERTLANRDRPVQMRWNHFGPIIGKWTLIQEDDRGLYVEGELTPGHSQASDTAALLKHKAIDGLSIGYFVRDSEMEGPVNVLKEIELIEISVVEEPADLAARISDVKAQAEKARTLKEVESILRDAGGFSRSDATALVSRVRMLSHGDRVDEKDASDLKALIGQLSTTIKGDTHER